MNHIFSDKFLSKSPCNFTNETKLVREKWLETRAISYLLQTRIVRQLSARHSIEMYSFVIIVDTLVL